MAKKRANGEGNIRKRKDGRWEGRYTAGHDPITGIKPYIRGIPLTKLSSRRLQRLYKRLSDGRVDRAESKEQPKAYRPRPSAISIRSSPAPKLAVNKSSSSVILLRDARCRKWSARKCRHCRWSSWRPSAGGQGKRRVRDTTLTYDRPAAGRTAGPQVGGR